MSIVAGEEHDLPLPKSRVAKERKGPLSRVLKIGVCSPSCRSHGEGSVWVPMSVGKVFVRAGDQGGSCVESGDCEDAVEGSAHEITDSVAFSTDVSELASSGDGFDPRCRRSLEIPSLAQRQGQRRSGAEPGLPSLLGRPGRHRETVHVRGRGIPSPRTHNLSRRTARLGGMHADDQPIVTRTVPRTRLSSARQARETQRPTRAPAPSWLAGAGLDRWIQPQS